MKIGRYLSKIGLGVPSFFDLCVIGFLLLLPFIAFVNVGKYRLGTIGDGLACVYGSIFVITMSLVAKQQRKFSNPFLGLFVLLSFVYMFMYSFRVGEFSQDWVNFSLMNEGFIYILFSALLIRTIVCYADQYRWYYIALIIPILFSYWLMFDSYLGWSMTPLMAFFVASTVSLWKWGKKNISIVLGLIGATIALLKWKWLYFKFCMRPLTWLVTWRDIKEHWFVGRGFDTSFNGWQGFVTVDSTVTPDAGPFGGLWGRGFINNDYLELWRSLGWVAVFLLACFVLPYLRKEGKLAYLLAVMFLVMCFFQRTVFFPVRGAIIVVVMSLLILEGMAQPSLPK